MSVCSRIYHWFVAARNVLARAVLATAAVPFASPIVILSIPALRISIPRFELAVGRRWGRLAAGAAVLFAAPTALASTGALVNTGPLDDLINFLTGPLGKTLAVAGLVAVAIAWFSSREEGSDKFIKLGFTLVGIVLIAGAVTFVDGLGFSAATF